MSAAAQSRSPFALFVERVLADARSAGMTDKTIAAAANLRASTFHRWQNGEVMPQLSTVEQFCIGLGVPVAEALDAIQRTSAVRVAKAKPTPRLPPMDPDVLKILRILADPDVSAEQKTLIRQMLRSLARLKTPEETHGVHPQAAVRKVAGNRATPQRGQAHEDRPAQARRRRLG